MLFNNDVWLMMGRVSAEVLSAGTKRKVLKFALVKSMVRKSEFTINDIIEKRLFPAVWYSCQISI
jgi:hypothetical protein